MFRRLEDGPAITMTWEGRPIRAQQGDSVAGALLSAGVVECRETPKSGARRGPFCMMGSCFECLVVINGMPNRQSCMVPAAEGLRVERQCGAGALALDGAPDLPGEEA
ncbi:MAG: (2Fe-2S)-binding protein [Pseudomonadota bacterium]